MTAPRPISRGRYKPHPFIPGPGHRWAWCDICGQRRHQHDETEDKT